MPDFQFQEMFPQSAGDTPFRKLTDDGVSIGEYRGRRVLEVDGGINAHTAPLVVAQGADVLVAGNAVFTAADYQKAIEELRNAADRAALPAAV